MTTHTVESVMELVDNYAKSPSPSQTVSLLTAIQTALPRRDTVRTAIESLVAERDQWKKFHKELVEDLLPDDMECLPQCDSYGHGEECPVLNAQAAARNLIEQRDQAVKESAELKKAIIEHAPMWSDSKTCCYCGSLWSMVNHAPDCIVRKCEEVHA